MKIVEDPERDKLLASISDVDPVELGKRAARDTRPKMKCMLADAFRITDPVVGVLLFERRPITDYNRRIP